MPRDLEKISSGLCQKTENDHQVFQDDDYKKHMSKSTKELFCPKNVTSVFFVVVILNNMPSASS